MSKFKIGDRFRRTDPINGGVEHRRAGYTSVVSSVNDEGIEDEGGYFHRYGNFELIPADKFKPGDSVVRVDEEFGNFKKGDVGTVLECCGEDLYFVGDSRRYATESFAHEFKPGDRVRFVSSYCGSAAGCAATVIRTPPETWGVQVRQDDGDTSTETPTSLELIPTLSIKAGRYYKTRDGRKVGPVRDCGGFFNADGWDYDAQGRCGLCGKFNEGEAHRRKHDLIAEWPSEFTVGDRIRLTQDNEGFGDVGNTGVIVDCYNTAARVRFDRFVAGDRLWRVDYDRMEKITAATAKAGDKPKFKVGDAVKVVRHCNWRGDKLTLGVPVGEVRTISALKNQLDHEGIQSFLLSGDNLYFYTPLNVELISSSPAIVCLIEDGKPKPATNPFVHPSAEAAAKEAGRLASVHKGKSFGVYTLGEVRREEPVYDHEWQRLAKRSKLAAIKEIRAMTGLGLKATKDAVEDWLERQRTTLAA